MFMNKQLFYQKDLNFKKCATNGMESKAISYILPYLHVLDV